MTFAPLLPTNFIIIFCLVFLFIIIISQLNNIKYLILRVFTFIVFIICIINPQISSKNDDLYKDIVLVVSDLTQSVKETEKENEVLSIENSLNEKLNKLNNLEIINLKLSNAKEVAKDAFEGTKTSLFREINDTINHINLKRLSSIIVITDGQIHDFDNYNKALSQTPIHFILVGDVDEKDRMLTTKNVPKYSVIGKKYDYELKIIDNTSEEKVKVSFFLNGKMINYKYLVPNKIHIIELPKLNTGKNIYEIKVNKSTSEISSINNNQIFEINGVQDKLRVMLISGEPNMGLRNLRNILNSDPAIELIHFTILRPPTKRDLTPVKELSLIPFPTQELFAADISKFNLIIFDQYGLQGILPPKYLGNISRFVLEGGALLDISGKKYLTQDSLINSPIKQILPTKPEESYIGKGFTPKLTQIGTRHPITNKINSSFTNKPWGSWYSFTKSKITSGKALIHHDNFPLLVVDNVGEGRVAQILSNQTWVWQKSQNNKGPLVELLRNTIQWLLKNPIMEEDFVNIIKKEDLIEVKLNSLTLGDISARVITPSKKNLDLILKDNKNGILKGEFKTKEIGKFKIIFNGRDKNFIIGKKNTKETQNIKSSALEVEKYMSTNPEKTKYFNISWYNNKVPEVVKVYNKKILSGKNWIGINENNITKTGFQAKESLLGWHIILLILISLFFLNWYKDSKY